MTPAPASQPSTVTPAARTAPAAAVAIGSLRDTFIGLAMGLAAALIGGGWQVATRQATTAGAAPIAPDDLVLLRYGVPALLLAPVAWRSRARLSGIDRRRVLLMFVGAGFPFGLVAIAGTRFAPTAHMGVLMAGASPLIAALLALLWWGERPAGARRAGLLLMAVGVALLAAPVLSGWRADSWRGDLLFLLAATLWALFTLSFRGGGLSAWQAAAWINVGSFAAALAWLVLRGGSTLLQAPVPVLATQLVWQGVLAGVLGLWTYAVAIERLGAAPAAAFGALVPVVSTLGGWLWLGERPGALEGVAVLLAVLGVLLASGVLAVRTTPRTAPAARADDR